MEYSENNDILFGMKILWIFFWGHHKIGLYLGVIFYAFYGLFLRSTYRMGIFFGLLKFRIFFGVLEIPDIYFEVNGRCWVRAYV